MHTSGWLQAGAAQALLWRRSRPALVRRALDRRPYRRAAPIAGTTLRAAAVQRHLHLTSSAEQYAAEAYVLVAAAVAYGAQLVCLPEYNGLHLLGLLPGAASLDPSEPLEDALAAVTGGGEVEAADLFRLVGPAAGRIFTATWSTLAQRFGVYLAAGSLLLPDRTGRLYNTLFFYDPSGRCLGVQHKLTLFPSEAGWVTPGDRLTLFQLPNTTLAAPMCMDHTYWETARIAAAGGAELLVNPAANDHPYSWWTQSRGLWSRVQETPAFGIQPMLVGDFFGFRFRGCSGIYAPLALSAAGDGILDAVGDDQGEGIVTAELDLAALRELRRETPAPRRALVERYLPGLYDAHPPPAARQVASGSREV